MSQELTTPLTPVQNHIHTWADQGPKIDIKAERNSRGYNWEIKVSGAKSTDEALAMLADADAKLKAQFAPPEEKVAEPTPAEKPKEKAQKVEEK
jgi:hypothetical protein